MKRPVTILTVVGARPQFVKAAVVSRALKRLGSRARDGVREIICHTGQHYDYAMDRVFFEEMEIAEPAVNLGVGSGPHGEITGSMMIGIEREILQHRPDCVLVYGDTNSTLAGALAAAKLQVLLAHVEAGLRSFNRIMPEEINRVVTDRLAQLLFCPSVRAAEQLRCEGVGEGIYVTGDVMYDSFLHYSTRRIPPDEPGPFALATIHRAENTDDAGRLQRIMTLLDACPVPIVLPMHPRTRAALNRTGFRQRGSLRITGPMSYFRMLGCLHACRFVVTDSGGLQKEAYFAGKKCITLRTETEWVELVDAGANRIVGVDEALLHEAFLWADDTQACIPEQQLYGSGRSGDRMAEILLEHLGG